MNPSKLRTVGWLWALALAMSLLLAAAGRRWPDPLVLRPALVAALLILPPLAMTLWLLSRWPVGATGGGESLRRTESSANEQERS